MRGIGTDEKVIIDILTGHNNVQRQIIKKKYKTIYGRILTDDIKAELGGHFEDVCLALLCPLVEYIVDCLYFAVKGLKTDENCIIEILVSLEYMELKYVKSVFREKYDDDLGEFLCSGLRGDMRKLISTLTSRDREHYVEVDEQSAVVDAHHLYDAGLSKSWGSDEDLFINILATRSKNQLRATIAAYERIAGHLMEEAIKSEFGGNIRHALLAIVANEHTNPGRTSVNASKTTQPTSAPFPAPVPAPEKPPAQFLAQPAVPDDNSCTDTLRSVFQISREFGIDQRLLLAEGSTSSSSTFNDPNREDLLIGFWNANGVLPKTHELRDYISEHAVDFFLVQ
ncbi:annexin A5-like [Stegodyphus dumicola]|uniref:annexin A5-like n=1 Tax=Stegodyphus dumicola TaxID=202533 RepID=UPI0015A7F63F|nr:annexin A5-like [Stegodyphus dumicola]